MSLKLLQTINRKVESFDLIAPRPKKQPKRDFAHLPLAQFVRDLNPGFDTETHLAVIRAEFERSHTERVFVVINAPPQHGKSETVKHGIAQYIARHPDRLCAYISATASFAQSKSVEIREICERIGVEMDPARQGKSEWRTAQGGGLVARGIGGQLSGFSIKGLLVLDDPYKDDKQAASPTYRETVAKWFERVAFPRLNPPFGSCIIVHTRWHPEDISGRLTKVRDGRVQWRIIRMQAIDAHGDPLWPARYPLALLLAIKQTIGDFAFAALYQQSPMPRGGSVFRDPERYLHDPYFFGNPGDVAIGMDVAATAKTSADYTAIVVLRRVPGPTDAFRVVEVWRGQVETPAGMGKLQEVMARYPGAPAYVEESGVGKPVVQVLQSLRPDLPIHGVKSIKDKFTRAQRCAAVWNSGGFKCPVSGDYLAEYLEEMTTFTGLGDAHDDMVDATVMAFEGLKQGAGGSFVL